MLPKPATIPGIARRYEELSDTDPVQISYPLQICHEWNTVIHTSDHGAGDGQHSDEQHGLVARAVASRLQAAGTCPDAVAMTRGTSARRFTTATARTAAMMPDLATSSQP